MWIMVRNSKNICSIENISDQYTRSQKSFVFDKNEAQRRKI